MITILLTIFLFLVGFIEKEASTFKQDFWKRQQNNYDQTLNEKMMVLKKVLEENFEMESNESLLKWEGVRKEVHTRVIKKFEEVVDDLKNNSLQR